MVKSVTYLGYKVDCDGIHPLQEKVKAVKDAPKPKCDGTQIVFGSSDILFTDSTKYGYHVGTPVPFMKSNATWKWDIQDRQAFEAAKSLLTSKKVLVHFDSSLDLLLACDVSACGLGAVLSHKMPDARIQRWAVTMAAYQYSIGYKNEALYNNADG